MFKSGGYSIRKLSAQSTCFSLRGYGRRHWLDGREPLACIRRPFGQIPTNGVHALDDNPAGEEAPLLGREMDPEEQ
jgi:hypothetical protein